MTGDDDIPEDRPLGPPGHARAAHEQDREPAGDDPPRLIFPWTNAREIHRIDERRRRERRAHERALRELGEGQGRLLLRIEQEQAKIEQRRKQIEDNALRLRDGRRVYGDGDRFRDGQGQLLTGADEAEAAHQHEYRRDAPAWAQKQDIDRRAAEAQGLKNKILQDREGGQGTPGQVSLRLAGYEQEFREKVEARPGHDPAEFGNAGYVADREVPSAVPAFTAAAAPRPAVLQKSAKDQSGGAAARMKQPLREEGEHTGRKARAAINPGAKPRP